MVDIPSNPEFKQQWRRNWLDSLRELSDYSLQLYSWRGGLELNNPHWSFIEFMCCYFDDCNLSEGYAWAVDECFVSPEEADAVASFHAAADLYKPPNGDYDDTAILQDSNWQEVVQLAVAACNSLSHIIADPEERTILSRVRANNSFKPRPLRGSA